VLITILGAGDEAALEAFLVQHVDSSMFLRANARRAGLVDGGQRFQGTYAAAWQDGAIVAVAAAWWNGMLSLQVPAPAQLEVAHVAVERSGRAVSGLTGPAAQVAAARSRLGLDGRPTQMDDREDLFGLTLADLRLPPALADGRWQRRAPLPEELPLLARWRAEYEVESLGATPGPELDEKSRQAMAAGLPHSVLVVDGELRAMTTFNARLPDVVQIGGVYTPPALRGRGYARAVVAGSLLAVRAEGVGRALLFTGAENHAARRAYLALGFRIIGDYSLVLF
jgi:uncharacterized protein